MGEVTRAWLLVLAACGGRPASPADSATVTVETFAELRVGPGNIAVTPDQRVIVSLHQFYDPKDPVVEVKGGQVVPFPGVPLELDSVLGIRADDRGVVWMLDNAMRERGTRKLVGWNTKTAAVELTVDLMAVSPDDAFLNDLAVDRTHGAIYIADPAGGKNAALIVVDLATGQARRVLEGHASVVPEERDLVIDGKPVQIKQPDGSLVRPRVGVNPIALDSRDEWLYFGAMHATTLYRVRTADLRGPEQALASKVERYADRPITDGISIDMVGNIYLGDLAANAIGVIGTDRRYRRIASGAQLSWIDAFSFGSDGNYYVIANQLHRSAVLNAGSDESRPPYHILRFRPFSPGRVGR